MAIDYQDVVNIKKSLDDEYQEFHFKFRRMRDIYHGRYWEIAQSDSQTRSISSVFRDIGRANNNTLPPIKIVRNVIQQICVKYQSFLSPVPMVSYFTDAPETFERREEMTLKERYTYGIWRSGQMSQKLNNVAWYQPLMGDAFIGIFPDFKRKIPVPILRSPENAFPLKGFGDEVDGHIFFWKEPLSAVKRSYPEYASQIQAQIGKIREGRGSNPMVDVYEYSDGTEFSRWIQGVKVNGVEHNYGFDLFAHSKFIDIPGEPFGHSAVEQVVNLNEADNMITSLLFQAMLENIFPTIVLIDPAKAPEELMKGPGAIIPINQGGDFKVIAPPVQAVATQLEYLSQNERNIQEMAGMPPVNFGRSPATSIATGAAVNELQGAGTGSTVAMVQQGLGLVISQWCEKAIYMQKRMWGDTEITLNYVTPLTRAGGTGEKGSMTIKGNDMDGGTANEIVWSPAMDLHDKIVMWLQAKGAGLVSDEYILKQIGLHDPQAMKEEILMEEMERGMLGFIVNQLAQGGDMVELEGQGNALLEGHPRQVPLPPPPSPGGAAAPASAGPPAPGGAGGPQAIPEGGAAPGPPAAPEAAPLEGGPSEGPASINAVVSALTGGSYAGRVFLIGEIAVKGETDGAVDVAVTDPADRSTVASQAPQYQFRFHVVKGEPQEKFVEVTGG